MGQKLVVSGKAPATLAPLSLAEQEELNVSQAAALVERDRLAARTSAEVSEEDVLSPMFDQASSKDVKLIKAVALALLDGLNVERTARGAQTISPAQLRALVKTRLEEMV